MVRDGFGDESGAKLIEQRGIDFAPSEDFIQTLKGAGASEAFLNALRAAKPPEPASAKKPINQVQVFALLVGQVPSHRVTMLVEERGIDFEPTDDYLQEVRLAGGEDELISALKSAKVTKPATVDPAAQARQAEVRQHAAHGAELMQAKRYADAEAEYRAALRLDPQNADLHVSLGIALGSKGDGDGATAEFRHVLRSDPNNERAHVGLGIALGEMGDRDGEIAEEREALRLNPNDESAHHSLGVALDKKGDLQGALQEYREAYALAPQDPLFKDAYETYLKKVNDAHNLEKVQHWLGKWVFAGPVKASTGCNGTMFPLTVDLAEQYFEVLTISPAGEVTAWLDHPVEADQKVWGRPYWSGIATETTLVLTLNPMASGTLLLGGFTLRYAVGRLEARRDGDRYSVEFSYAESHSDNPMPKHGCRDYEDDKRFLGEMKRP
jgi:tetratricopeptide (TPR) repeat protein